MTARRHACCNLPLSNTVFIWKSAGGPQNHISAAHSCACRHGASGALPRQAGQGMADMRARARLHGKEHSHERPVNTRPTANKDRAILHSLTTLTRLQSHCTQPTLHASVFPQPLRKGTGNDTPGCPRRTRASGHFVHTRDALAHHIFPTAQEELSYTMTRQSRRLGKAAGHTAAALLKLRSALGKRPSSAARKWPGRRSTVVGPGPRGHCCLDRVAGGCWLLQEQRPPCRSHALQVRRLADKRATHTHARRQCSRFRWHAAPALTQPPRRSRPPSRQCTAAAPRCP